ncbi:uncharacterized protein [Sinocyclocheilus grahami]|uniref:Uncharacterized LOC107553247 n=1 Tax=Sinocyclocheilus grahami TaxID=75366 RepID=A0A672LH12_SINGR|nr:PREDICTED: uncharacterized protein LOC107553247 [Sinocyclocheilus grahami]
MHLMNVVNVVDERTSRRAFSRYFFKKRRSPMESNANEDLMLSQGMDLRILVVVFSMVASELSHVHTRPIDFVCDSEARRMMNKVKDLQVEMGVCSAVDALPSDIKLPCIRIHKATWERKSVHEKRAEILLSLGTLAQDVRSARTLSQTGCGLTLLERLEHSINNYLHVVRLLHIEVRTTSSTLCCSSDRYWHRDLWCARRIASLLRNSLT